RPSGRPDPPVVEESRPTRGSIPDFKKRCHFERSGTAVESRKLGRDGCQESDPGASDNRDPSLPAPKACAQDDTGSFGWRESDPDASDPPAHGRRGYGMTWISRVSRNRTLAGAYALALRCANLPMT